MTLLNNNFDFDVSVANDVAIDVAKCKVMQGSLCLEVRTLINENVSYIQGVSKYLLHFWLRIKF